MGLRYELYTRFRSGRTERQLSEFRSHLRALAGILDQSAAYLSNRLERLGAACSGGLERAPRSACAHGRGDSQWIPPKFWQDNLLTGQRLTLFIRASMQRKTGRFPFGFQITPDELPKVYNTAGVNVLASGNPKNVPANTVMDVNRYQQDLAALAPSHQLSATESGRDRPALRQWLLADLDIGAGTGFRRPSRPMSRMFGTSAFRLPRMSYPNAVSRSGFGICAVYRLRR